MSHSNLDRDTNLHLLPTTIARPASFP
ncbi:hypothetical protein A2U01_0119184, partial [Trifolium medium]|nr:hypothetical protein [Trifolium medium]